MVCLKNVRVCWRVVFASLHQKLYADWIRVNSFKLRGVPRWQTWFRSHKCESAEASSHSFAFSLPCLWLCPHKHNTYGWVWDGVTKENVFKPLVETLLTIPCYLFSMCQTWSMNNLRPTYTPRKELCLYQELRVLRINWGNFGVNIFRGGFFIN